MGAWPPSGGGGSGNATQLQGRNLAATAPADTQVVTWVAGDNAWEPKPIPAAAGALLKAPTTTAANTVTPTVNTATALTLLSRVGQSIGTLVVLDELGNGLFTATQEPGGVGSTMAFGPTPQGAGVVVQLDDQAGVFFESFLRVGGTITLDEYFDIGDPTNNLTQLRIGPGTAQQVGPLLRIRNVAGDDALGITTSGALDVAEQVDPVAPAADTVRIYARDDGGGTTQLAARFADGSISILGTEAAGAVAIVTKHLTTADLSTLFSAPVEILPAPGAGKAIAVVQMYAAQVPILGNWAPVGTEPNLYYAGDVVNPHQIAAWDSVPSILSNGTGQPAVESLLAAFASQTPGIWVAPAYENQPVVFSQTVADGNRIGGLLAATVNAAGVGYAVGDTGTVDVVNWVGGAQYVVDTVSGLGAVLTFHLDSEGDGYDPESNWGTTPGGAQPGIGVGFTVDIAPGDIDAQGDLYLTVVYHVATIN